MDNSYDKLWDFAITDRTKAQYNIGVKTYKRFLCLSGIHYYSKHPPVNESILIKFVSYCDSSLNLRHATIKLYLCGVRFYFMKHCGFSPLENDAGGQLACLKTIMNGIKKKQGVSTKIRLPITTPILRNMCRYLQISILSHFNALMIKTACIFAFFGFLRCGEFTVLNTFDEQSNLCYNDVTVKNDVVYINLKRSKTDPFRKGVTIQLHKTGNELCPVHAANLYITTKASFFPISPQPFFIDDKGSALTRAFFISQCKKVLQQLGHQPAQYNGHSFRIGAATSASSLGLQDHLIKTLGRWSSDCYVRYIRTEPVVIKDAQMQLASM